MKKLVILFFAAAGLQAQVVRDISDNSFLLHEAYNQEKGVVQHVFTFASEDNLKLIEFSQEWPLFSERHQLSYAIPYIAYSAGSTGFADLRLMYRYQLSGQGDWAASAPSIAVVLPLDHRNAGSRRPGYEFLLPVSSRLSSRFTAHFNAGVFIYPGTSTETSAGDMERTADRYLLAASIIWLTGFNYNILLEYLYNHSSEFDAQGEKSYSSTHVVNPGIRFAIDRGNLQIVPGIAFPVSLTERTAGLLLYLSLEHPF